MCIFLVLLGETAFVDQQLELLHGTLDMLILQAVSLGSFDGYGILLCIQQSSKDRLEIQQGSVYPARYRLEHQGWIASEWGEWTTNQKGKYNGLPPAGNRGWKAETEKGNGWQEAFAGTWTPTPEQDDVGGVAFGPGA